MSIQVLTDTSEIFIAIIGIIGTLLGTVLGWVLNNLSQHGKLNVYITNFKEDFTTFKLGCSAPCRKKEEIKAFSYNLSIDLYNSSGTTKIMRNIRVVLLGKNEDLVVDIPQDSDSARSSHPIIIYDDVEPVNISPKSVEKLNLRGYFSDEAESFDFVWLADKIELRYTNEKNKEKVVPIKKVNYNKVFYDYSVEAENNGQA